MTDVDDAVTFLVAQGEDYVAQMFWTDDLGNAVQLSGRALLTCYDGNGQTIFQASPSSDPTVIAEQAVLQVGLTQGFIQLSIPNAITSTLVPGVYGVDMLVETADDTGPFANQFIPLFTSYLQVAAVKTLASALMAQVL